MWLVSIPVSAFIHVSIFVTPVHASIFVHAAIEGGIVYKTTRKNMHYPTSVRIWVKIQLLGMNVLFVQWKHLNCLELSMKTNTWANLYGRHMEKALVSLYSICSNSSNGTSSWLRSVMVMLIRVCYTWYANSLCLFHVVLLYRFFDILFYFLYFLCVWLIRTKSSLWDTMNLKKVVKNIVQITIRWSQVLWKLNSSCYQFYVKKIQVSFMQQELQDASNVASFVLKLLQIYDRW